MPTPMNALPNPLWHQTDWDEEKSATFWKIFSEVGRELFFSHRAGAVFLDVVRRHLGRRVLDLGCGDGTLVMEMRRRGYDAIGADPSAPEGPHFVRSRGTELGALGDEPFDSVVSLETFEHVLPDQLPATLCGIARVLKPGGKLIFTVPFEEDMVQAICVCPDCHAVFHRFQHQQSFSRQKLRNLLEPAGFDLLSFREFEVPIGVRYVPAFLRSLYSHAWGWLKKVCHRNVSLLVVAQRRVVVGP